MSEIIKDQCIALIMQSMKGNINEEQLAQLEETITETFKYVDITLMANPLSTLIMDNETILKKYIVDKAYAGCTKKTITRYSFIMIKFFRVIPIPYNKITADHIKEYLLYRETCVSKRTVDGERHCLSSFFSWLFDQEYIKKDVMKNVGVIKVPQTQKRCLSEIEVISIIDACKNSRELALIDLCLSCGLRINEICEMKISDINFQEDSILIHGKGNKERIVYMNIRCKKHIVDYIDNIDGKRKTRSIYLFSPSFTENISKDKPLTQHSINRILYNVCERANVNNVTIHTFRRYFATHLMNMGGALDVVSDLLGHASTSTTSRYYVGGKGIRAKELVQKFS